MKIAFAFYGHPRTFRENTTLIPNLIERYPGDIFIHIYPTRDLSADQVAWHADRAGSGVWLTDDDKQWIRDTYPNIKAFVVDPLPNSTYYVPSYAAKFGGRDSGAKVQALRRAYEQSRGTKYDVVFRMRFDLVLLEPFVLPETIDDNTLYGAYNLTAIENNVDDDLFNYGNPRVIDGVFGEAFPPEEALKITGYGFQGEALVTSIRKARGFDYKSHVPMKCGLLRSTGLMPIRI